MERMVQFLFADAAMMFVVDVLWLGFSVPMRKKEKLPCELLGFTVKMIHIY